MKDEERLEWGAKIALALGAASVGAHSQGRWGAMGAAGLISAAVVRGGGGVTGGLAAFAAAMNALAYYHSTEKRRRTVSLSQLASGLSAALLTAVALKPSMIPSSVLSEASASQAAGLLAVASAAESLLGFYEYRSKEQIQRSGKGAYVRGYVGVTAGALYCALLAAKTLRKVSSTSMCGGSSSQVVPVALLGIGLVQLYNAARAGIEGYYRGVEEREQKTRTQQWKKVCVIGAGPSGLTVCKEMLEAGHSVVVLERGGDVGGVFRHCYEGAMLTTSTMMTPYSDFHPSGAAEDKPLFWSAPRFGEYLEDYAWHYHVLPHVRFHTEVVSVEHLGIGQGVRVTTRRTSSEDQPAAEEEVHHFDHVVVSTGTNAVICRPHFEGEESFEGVIKHSADFTDAAVECKNKRVVLIGGGESASDISLLVARQAAQVTVSMRDFTHGWNIPRYIFGWPFDLDSTWCHHAIPNWLIWYHDIGSMYAILAMGYVLFRPEWVLWAKWILRKRRSTFETFGVKNLSMAEAVAKFGAKIRPHVRRITPTAVEFEDGSSEPADLVIVCTGFQNRFDFLNGALREEDVCKVDHLYLHAIHPRLGTDVVLLGFARAHFAPVPPVVELQARYVAGVWGGRYELPSAEEMEADIAAHRAYKIQQYGRETSDRLGSLFEYLLLVEKMAGLIGCQPPFAYYALTDPWLYVNLLIAPMVTARYRLYGPGSKPVQARLDVTRYPISFQAYAHLAMMAGLSALHWIGIPVGMKSPLY